MTHEEKLLKRRETYQRDKEKILKQNEANRQKHIVKRKATSKKWRHDNKELKKKTDADYYQSNKEKIKARVKKYNEENKEDRAKYISDYYKTKKGKLIALTTRQKRRGIVLSTEDGSVTTESLSELLMSQKNKCHHCGCELDHETSRAVHLDHLVPLSKGGTHTLDNVAWSCAYCNLTKNDRLTP